MTAKISKTVRCEYYFDCIENVSIITLQSYEENFTKDSKVLISCLLCSEGSICIFTVN